MKTLVKETASSAIYLGWDEGIRSHESFRDSEGSQFNIDEMIIKNGVVTFMTVIINGNYRESTNNDNFNRIYSCVVELKRYELNDALVSEYAKCETDQGEEIEYEH